MLRKRETGRGRTAVWFGITAAAGLAFLSAGCGDDGGGGSTESVSFTVDGTAKTYSTNAAGGIIGGSVTAIAAEASTGPSLIGLIVDGTTAGTYTVAADTLMVLYTNDAGTDFAALFGVVGSGEVTITSFGAVGGRIEGTFFAVVDDGASATLDIISGTFDVVREPDA